MTCRLEVHPAMAFHVVIIFTLLFFSYDPYVSQDTLMERLWIVVFSLLTLVTWTSSLEKFILEAPECGGCTWTWTPVPSSGGWGHPSGQNTGNRYEACRPNSNQQLNNWLRSHLITVGDLERLYVTVEHRSFACASSHTFCNESLFAYVWESNTSVSEQQIPHPIDNFSSYRRYAIIKRLSDNKEISTIPLQVKSKFIVLGFRDQGGCRTLFSVKVSYKVCPGETLKGSLVSLPETQSDVEPVPVEGSCLKDSAQVGHWGSLIVLCQSNGEWNTSRLQGKCVCKEGMENESGSCKACTRGTYNDGKGLNCTVIPSEPRNTSVSFINESSAVITWLPPAVTGTQTDLMYDVDCRKSCTYFDKDCDDERCDSDFNALLQNAEGLRITNFTINNLASFVNYTCKVSAKNRVSEVAERSPFRGTANFTLVNLRTVGSVPGKPDVTIHLAEDGAIELSWKLSCKNGIIQEYRVVYFKVDDSSDTEILTTKETGIRITSLAPGATFEFRVFAVNNFGTGPPGTKTFKMPSGRLSARSKIIIGAAAGGGSLLLIIIITVVVFFIFRFRRRSPRSIQKEYMRTLEQGIGDELDMSQRRYIDPGNYQDLMELLTTFTTEIERSKTKLDGMIGQGEFADVYKGTLQTSKGKQVVAVKVLRPGSNEKNQKDFLSEASIMGQFNHPNVIQLIGVVTQSRPMMILAEFLESGSLDHFLKLRSGQLTALQLLGMARGVANGMVYLSEMNFIHRDLAARNILVGENMSCKVSDFGLSRELADDNPDSEYETQGGKIPVRWTAPEALQSRKFSSASDVWSYGILVWEIMSFADRPYWDWNNYDVINRVETGYRLPSPKGCPKVVHGLMLECWESDKNKRPKFAEIVTRLDELFRFPEVLNDDLLSVTNKPEKDTLPQFRSVDEWLKFINMERYSEVLKTAKVNDMDKVARLGDRELRDMGIKLIGHRNKMNKSIRAMNKHFDNRGLDDDEAAI